MAYNDTLTSMTQDIRDHLDEASAGYWQDAEIQRKIVKRYRELWARIIAIRDLFDQTLARCRAKLPAKVYSKELVELVFTQPYCKIQFLVDARIAQRQTASEYLQELEKLGILKGEKQGREVIYKHPALLKVLTA